MLFVIAEDATVSVFESAAQACAACEGIDVENGVFAFYADDGTPLSPRFLRPTKRTLFGMLVENGAYELAPGAAASAGPDEFELAMSRALSVEPNACFRTVSEIRAHVHASRVGGDEGSRR